MGTYQTISALSVLHEYDELQKMGLCKQKLLPIAKNSNGFLLCTEQKEKGIEGAIFEWDGKNSKKLSDNFGKYIECLRDNLLLRKLKYDDKQGIID